MKVTVGFLTGQMNADTKFDETDFRNLLPRYSKDAMAANMAIVDLVKLIAKQKNASPAQIALSWVMAQKPWIIPIPGTTKLHRLEENIKSVNVQLTAEDLKKIRDVISKIQITGERYNTQMNKTLGK